MSTALETLFIKTRSENRAALIAYIPAGFPSQQGCKNVISVLAEAGVDAVEIGFPYSDPVMDGPTIQEAASIALKGGTGATQVFSILNFAHGVGLPAVVMTYWNPIERFGVHSFAQEISRSGGSAVITPDLTIEESEEWRLATAAAGINSIYVVAPSTKEDRLAQVIARCSGFVYAASLMGVTGTRATISSGARNLVVRIRQTTDMPIAVGLGVSTRQQASEIANYADGVIVGSAFIKILLDAQTEESGLIALRMLADDLVLGVREGR
jgi:tryptophan synthase alpha chain